MKTKKTKKTSINQELLKSLKKLLKGTLKTFDEDFHNKLWRLECKYGTDSIAEALKELDREFVESDEQKGVDVCNALECETERCYLRIKTISILAHKAGLEF